MAPEPLHRAREPRILMDSGTNSSITLLNLLPPPCGDSPDIFYCSFEKFSAASWQRQFLAGVIKLKKYHPATSIPLSRSVGASHSSPLLEHWEDTRIAKHPLVPTSLLTESVLIHISQNNNELQMQRYFTFLRYMLFERYQ